MARTSGYAAHSATSPLVPFQFDRRAPGARDVQIEILFCGVCHSDLHTARNEWANTRVSRRPRARDRRPRDTRGRQRDGIQGR